MDKQFFNGSPWYKIWGGGWSLTTCSYWGIQYTRTLWVGSQITFSDKAVFTINGNNNACFIPTASRDRFGTYLAQQIEHDKRFARVWCELLMLHVDRIRNFMGEYNSKDINSDAYKKFWDLEFDYYISHIFNKYAVDYLPPQILTEFLPLFEKARVYGEPVFNETEEFLEKWAKTVSDKNGYEKELVLSMLKEEVDIYIATGSLPSKQSLRDRANKSALLFDRNSSRLIIVGQEVEELEGHLLEWGENRIIKGVTAYPGTIIGLVKIVTDPNRAHIENGEILVTGMTRPDYLPLMKKAAAFVTDSGGILSHAAIVAREMKKPCVIGTHSATRRLKDGDRVRVNADKGIVELL